MIQHRTHEATASFIKNLTFRVNIVFFCIIKYFEIHLVSSLRVHVRTKGQRERNMRFETFIPNLKSKNRITLYTLYSFLKYSFKDFAFFFF